MIRLGLGRISQLVDLEGQHLWKTVHVAGTNGKGSICAYIARLLRVDRPRVVGDFTSPSLIDEWDCIKLNGKPISEQQFRAGWDAITEIDTRRNVGATQFERLTATAMHVFQKEPVDYAVIEAGMGGESDATNVLDNKAVTVISKVGLDHQEFLGKTIEDIARNKAGIMRPEVPCVVDSSNPPEVLDVLRRHAQRVGTEITVATIPRALERRLLRQGFLPHQIHNGACAMYAYYLLVTRQPAEPPSLLQLLDVLKKVSVPGRLQTVDIQPLTGLPREARALLDGAHNVQSAEVLATYVDKNLRGTHSDGPIAWVMSMTAGKDHEGIMRTLLRPQDSVAATQFARMPDMPWVAPEEPGRIVDLATQAGIRGDRSCSAELIGALKWATQRKAPVVIAGSLYLVRTFLREMRARGNTTTRQIRLKGGNQLAGLARWNQPGRSK